MVVTTVMVNVKPEHIEDFIKATILNHEASVNEAGNMRFDILQSDDDPGKFLLYEAYSDAETAAAHKQTDHYAQWRDAVAEWMTEARKGFKYTSIVPH